MRRALGRQFGSFRYHYDGEALAILFAGGRAVANLLNGEGNLGDQDDVRAASNTGLKSDQPASRPIPR